MVGALVLVAGAAAIPHAGDLDSSFGGAGPGPGRVYIAPEAGADDAHAVAVQPDGKIVVAGFADSNRDLGVMRLNPNGTLDTTFGTGGHLVVPTGAATAIALQKDGKIVVVGRLGTNHLGLVRLQANGTLDGSFGSGGKVNVTVGSTSATGSYGIAVALQADGKVLVAGYATYSTGLKAIVGRFTTSGSLDTTFASSGWFSSTFGRTEADATGVAVQSDGKIVVGGNGYTKGTADVVAFARLTTTGALDTTFGTAGTRVVGGPGGVDADILALALQPDGKAVASGVLSASGGDRVLLVRVDASGNLDSTFGTGGVATPTGLTILTGQAAGIAVQADGKLVVPLSTVESGRPIFAVARYLANGSTDAGFGTGGLATARFGIFTGGESAYSVAVQPDGKILAAGVTDLGDAGLQWGVARFLAEGATKSGAFLDIGPLLDTKYAAYVICPGRRSCSGTVTIVVPIPSCTRLHRVTGCNLGGQQFSVPAGGARKLDLALNARGLRYLRRHPGGHVVFLLQSAGVLRRSTESLKEQPALVGRCEPGAVLGGQLVVHGRLTPTLAKASVTVRFHSPSGKELPVDAAVGADGSFSVATAASEVGRWTSVAFFAGNATVFATRSAGCGTDVSAPEQKPPPPKQSSSLKLNCPPSWQQGGALPVLGSLAPGLSGQSIALVYKPAQGNSTSRSATTGSGGSFSDNGYVPNQSGSLKVTASWAGNASYDGSSASCTVPIS